MTEAEWLACNDPQRMLEYLRGKASERKLRLFGCGCCREVWELLPDRLSRKAVEASERFADGLISREKLGYVWGDARRAANVAQRSEDDTRAARWMVATLTEPDTQRLLHAVWSAQYLGEQGPQRTLQAALLRCIFPYPMRPINPDAAWQTTNAVTLARTVYDERRWELLPLLADLLEEAGCPQEVSAHCRGPGPHARGCWVVDLVIGKG